MRPRRLEIAAFGPFGGQVVIDFAELAEAGLFLIYGPTGAGKTSILDAICYALYGTVPGTRRPDRLRSDHAAAELDTQVALEFCLRGEDWRITRKPQHERAKRRGQGTTLQKPVATLARRGGGEWEPVASGVEEVGGRVLGLLGLDAAQFQQVVLLPQGEVQRALQADARERERLLSSLFDAGRFDAYTAGLAERARCLEAEVVQREQGLEELRREAAIRWRQVSGDEVDPTDQAALGRLAAAGTRLAAERAEAEQQALGRVRAALAAAEEAATLADRWQRRRAALATLAELDARQETHAADLDALERARRAAPLAALSQAQEGARAEAERARAEAASAWELVRERAATVDEFWLQPLLAGDDVPVPPLAEAARDHAQRWVDKLDALQETAARVQELREAAAAARATADQHRAGAGRAAQEAECLADQAQQTHEALRSAQAASAHLADLDAAAEQAEARAEAAAALPAREREHEQARRAALDAAEAANEAERWHLELLRRRLDGMAAELAEQLSDGQPCPVCGGTEHPSPAPSSATVTQDEVDAAEQAARAARAAAKAEDERAATARDRVTATAARAEGCDPDTAAERARRARAAHAHAAELASRAPGLAAEAERLTTAAEEARRSAETHRQEAVRADATASSTEEQAAGLDAQVAAVVGEGGLADVHARAQALLDALAHLETTARASAEAQRAAQRAVGQLAETAAAQGFASVGDAVAALRPDEEIAALAATLAERDRRRAAAEAVLADGGDDAAVAALDHAPDVEAARSRAAGAEAAQLDAVRAAAAASATARDLDRLARAHAEAAAALEPLRETAARSRWLADVCSGAGNELRMSLKRFVLAAFLEDITARASVHLRAMSSGRYTLRHSDERARHGAASGLGIVVDDAYTGVERDVGSLSGGETFQASLAMALGIADAVQSHAGGVQLETLFIDEGFGTLDPEALEQAMAELDRLREGGRMVGVISHVPALAERIPVRIRVQRGRDGSTATVSATHPS